jgi:hypothetical protein
MLKFIKSFFKKKEQEVAEVPYKVETPTPVKPAPVAEPTPVVAEQATEAMVESIAPAKKARKPRAPKADKVPAVKKPRAPRKPKAE